MLTDEENRGVENSIGLTVESTYQNNRRNADDNVIHTLNNEGLENVEDFEKTTNVADENVTEFRGSKNYIEDKISKGLTPQVNLDDANNHNSFEGNIITADDVIDDEKNERNERKNRSGRGSNNDCLGVFRTQNHVANEQAPANTVNINNESPMHALDRSKNSARQNDNQFESPETIIPDLNEGTSVQNINAPCSKTGIFSTGTNKHLVAMANTEEQSKCMVCFKSIMSKYLCTQKQNIICSQECLAKFKEKHSGNIVVGPLRANNFGINDESQSNLGFNNVENSRAVENTKCRNCVMPIQNLNNSFSWETLDFCNEKCLRDYQRSFSPLCASCRTLIHDEYLLGRYRVRLGYGIRQFCTSMCLESYKENLKICAYCQDDISKYRNVFLASVRDRGMQKDFCSVQCIEHYNKLNQPLKDLNIAEECCVCHERTVIEIEFKFKNEINLICSQSCLLAFKIVNYITSAKCDFCYKYYSNTSIGDGYSIRYDGIFKRFCQETCRNNYITSNRKVYSCHWCKVKKHNFDMIQKYNEDNSVLITCSLFCLRSSITSAASGIIKWVICKVCRKVSKAKFCIVPTEGTIRYFCSFHCVQKYLQASGAQLVQPNTEANKYVVPAAPGPLPVITSVKSLASNRSQPRNAEDLRSSIRIPPDLLQDELSAPSRGKIILLKSTKLPTLRNVTTSTKPSTCDVGVNFKPAMNDKETLTEKLRSFNLIPVPVPAYVPTPMPMFNLVHLVPIPFPLPIPIPILIPLTIHATNKIFNKMKHQSDNASDFCETNILAGTFAENGKEMDVRDSNKNHRKEELIKTKSKENFGPYSDDTFDVGIQCDFAEPPIDFEENLPVNTITATSITTTQVVGSTIEKYVFPGQKSYSRQSILSKTNEQLEPPARLKHIYGVSAWKRWVDAKNEELEISCPKITPFKADIIELTPGELNSSLSLFIQEVRQPNGKEYTPDTIYYFCLGIQQHLYQLERADCIFYDEEYEDFVSALDVICRKFTICIDSQYIVTRIEEEHLWESKQLGAHSPYALLNTIMFLVTKYLDLMTVEDHMLLSFSKIVKCTHSVPNKQGKIDNSVADCEFLRYKPVTSKNEFRTETYRVNTREEDPLKCLVKLYDFYLSKCPKSAKTRNDVFYLSPKKGCTSNNMYWYTTTRLGSDTLCRMFHRIELVKEINVALLAL